MNGDAGSSRESATVRIGVATLADIVRIAGALKDAESTAMAAATLEVWLRPEAVFALGVPALGALRRQAMTLLGADIGHVAHCAGHAGFALAILAGTDWDICFTGSEEAAARLRQIAARSSAEGAERQRVRRVQPALLAADDLPALMLAIKAASKPKRGDAR